MVIIFLIDDIRIITTSFWEDMSFINKNALETIKILILEINPNYKFDMLDGASYKNDILFCYV